MDEATYQRWWPLHIRVAKDEVLAAEEQPFYEAGLRELDEDEKIGQASRTELREVRARVVALQSERANLLKRTRELEQEMTALEAALDERIRALLEEKG